MNLRPPKALATAVALLTSAIAGCDPAFTLHAVVREPGGQVISPTVRIGGPQCHEAELRGRGEHQSYFGALGALPLWCTVTVEAEGCEPKTFQVSELCQSRFLLGGCTSLELDTELERKAPKPEGGP